MPDCLTRFDIIKVLTDAIKTADAVDVPGLKKAIGIITDMPMDVSMFQ